MNIFLSKRDDGEERHEAKRGFKEVRPEFKVGDTETVIPAKATAGSAGYDIYTPVDLDIPPQTKVSFATNLKAYMQPGEVLLLFPRSSTGIKLDLELANSVAVGDADFYENEQNDGNYTICLWNRKPAIEIVDIEAVAHSPYDRPTFIDAREKNTVHIAAGTRVVQGIFLQTLSADSGNSDQKRKGGIGSTGD